MGPDQGRRAREVTDGRAGKGVRRGLGQGSVQGEKNHARGCCVNAAGAAALPSTLGCLQHQARVVRLPFCTLPWVSLLVSQTTSALQCLRRCASLVGDVQPRQVSKRSHALTQEVTGGGSAKGKGQDTHVLTEAGGIQGRSGGCHVVLPLAMRSIPKPGPPRCDCRASPLPVTTAPVTTARLPCL
eukprot:206628-Chlamydomonas_euryale.AAC.2